MQVADGPPDVAAAWVALDRGLVKGLTWATGDAEHLPFPDRSFDGYTMDEKVAIARDYLVPSRIHPGKFYALPQAPQQFKQLLMVAGFDRYFQIAPCFRDEDARADRSPGEFYQLDFEMSFVTQEDVFAAIEPVISGVFDEFADGRSVTKPPFPRIPYAESMLKYGNDKPDLRNPIVMQDVSEHFRGSGFKIFARLLEQSKNQVWAIPAPGGGQRTFADRMNSWAQGEGQPGLGYIFWREGEEGGAGPLAKNIGPERTKAVASQLGLKVGDACFFVAGKPKDFVKFAGLARTKVGEELNLIAKDRFDLCWIVDFPMFEWNEEEKKIDFSHNPFSMPNFPVDEFLALDAKDDEKILGMKAIQYDIVCNGVELSSGAIRNHRPDVMKKAFAIAGYGEDVLEAKFGGMLRALSLGAPPHGGIALGLDYGLTHSCYDPDPSGYPCGRCDSCRLRAAVFAQAGATNDQGVERQIALAAPPDVERRAFESAGEQIAMFAAAPMASNSGSPSAVPSPRSTSRRLIRILPSHLKWLAHHNPVDQRRHPEPFPLQVSGKRSVMKSITAVFEAACDLPST